MSRFVGLRSHAENNRWCIACCKGKRRFEKRKVIAMVEELEIRTAKQSYGG
jgi:hypothetical protein